MDFIYFLGRFHVLLLHIPITLTLVVVVLDWLSRTEKYKQFGPAVQPLWAATAISAVATAVLGYMHFSEGGFTGLSADAHRALGTSVALLTTLAWAARSLSLPIYRRVQTAVGLTLVALVTATGHFGGNLTHGDTYLVQYAPPALQRVVGFQASRPPVKDIAAADLSRHCATHIRAAVLFLSQHRQAAGRTEPYELRCRDEGRKERRGHCSRQSGR
jgi:hypothetical protein